MREWDLFESVRWCVFFFLFLSLRLFSHSLTSETHQVRVGDRAVMPEVPYRHWVYSRRWDNGDMSYMMALDLTKTSLLVECPTVVPAMELHDVEMKRQRVESLREAKREMKKKQEEEERRRQAETLKKIEEATKTRRPPYQDMRLESVMSK